MCVSIKYLLGTWHIKPSINAEEITIQVGTGPAFYTHRYEMKDIKHSQVPK